MDHGSNSQNAFQQSNLGLPCLSRPFSRQLVFKILEHPSQQFFSHVRMSLLPGLNQYQSAEKVLCSWTQHGDSACGETQTSNLLILSLHSTSRATTPVNIFPIHNSSSVHNKLDMHTNIVKVRHAILRGACSTRLGRAYVI